MRPAVQLDDALGDGEPEPGAALLLGVRAVDLMELLEDSRLLGRRRCRARCRVTATREHAIGRAGRNAHLARIRELDGVADEVEQHLGRCAARRPGRAAVSSGTVAFERSFLADASDSVAETTVCTTSLDRVVVEAEQLSWPASILERSSTSLIRPSRCLPFVLHALEHLVGLGRKLAVEAVLHELGVAEDGVERGAQLVAHVGEELRLVLARDLELLGSSARSRWNRRAL